MDYINAAIYGLIYSAIIIFVGGVSKVMTVATDISSLAVIYAIMVGGFILFHELAESKPIIKG